MKQKELKNLAKKIAEYEKQIQTSTDSIVVEKAKDEILKLTEHVSIFEIDQLDELIQKYLE